MAIIMDIEVAAVRPNPRQARKHFGDLGPLVLSLKEKGQLTPVVVRPVPGGYELVCGERRWRAAQLVGLATIKAEVREVSESEAFRLSLIENLQRARVLRECRGAVPYG